MATLSGKKFYIIGGIGAVNGEIERFFDGLGETRRIGGSDRYETSVNVARTFFSEPKGAVLAYGANFPDGLCGGSLANAMGGPLLLVANGKADKAAAYAKEYNIQGGAVLGGQTLINDSNPASIIYSSSGSGQKNIIGYVEGKMESLELMRINISLSHFDLIDIVNAQFISFCLKLF